MFVKGVRALEQQEYFQSVVLDANCYGLNVTLEFMDGNQIHMHQLGKATPDWEYRNHKSTSNVKLLYRL